MSAMKTPGVYVVEKSAFPNSVVEVATAVPAFIGYTERAINGTKSLLKTPWRISSMAEFVQYFGGAPAPSFSFAALQTGTSFLGIDANPSLKDVKSNTKKVLDAVAKAGTDKATADAATAGAAKDQATAAAAVSAKAAAALAGPYAIAAKDLSLVLKAATVTTGGAVATAADKVTTTVTAVMATPATKTAADLKTDVEALVAAINAVTASADPKPEADKPAEGDKPEGDKPVVAAPAAANADLPVKYYSVQRTDTYSLYYNMRLFFANGGGPCYIVSVGNYKDDVTGEKLRGGIDTLLNEQEPTMIVVPEAVKLASPQECYDIQTAALMHCGINMNRVAILDVYNGDKAITDPVAGDVITKFREKIGTEFLDYAAAYYPWLHTSIVPDNELSFRNIATAGISAFKDVLFAGTPRLDTYINKILATPDENDDITHKVLFKQSPIYATIVKAMVEQVNLLPPSAAMAGVYTLTDHTKEVWKAPANTGLANVISTAVNISYNDQENLNVPLDGKAINAIRYFTGEGIKVWGARTLDGNSLDWRYINVRRTMIMLEESIKNAAKAFVFDPNVANTWVIVRSTISNFLNGIWKRGGLAGAVPEDAFSVHVGLGDTMTPEDVLEGIMRITVLVAISRPAEFIEITFMQQMQKS